MRRNYVQILQRPARVEDHHGLVRLDAALRDQDAHGVQGGAAFGRRADALEGAERSTMFENAHTVADGLRVPKAIGDFLVLRAVRESDGAAVAVSDADMVTAMREMGALEGISAAPEGGAALHAVRVLANEGRIKPHDTVVIFNTGGALKYSDLLG